MYGLIGDSFHLILDYLRESFLCTTFDLIDV